MSLLRAAPCRPLGTAWALPLLLWSAAASAEGDGRSDAKGAAASGRPEAKLADGAKRADIMRLLQLTHAASMGDLAVQQLITTYRQTMPQVKDEIWQELKKEISSEELLLRLIPIYDKHFSAAELKELLRFYESPMGKKVTQVMPTVNQEAMTAGQTWGSEIAVRIKRRLDAVSPQPATTPANQPKK